MSVNFERGFEVFDFLQKTNEGIRLVFDRFLEEIEDTKKPFRNYLTFTLVSGLNLLDIKRLTL